MWKITEGASVGYVALDARPVNNMNIRQYVAWWLLLEMKGIHLRHSSSLVFSKCFILGIVDSLAKLGEI